MMQKSWIWVLGIAGVALTMSGCTRLEAGNGSGMVGWVNDILTPRETVLEKATSGFSVKGVLKNMPDRLVVLQEMRPDKMILIDSVRTDKSGNFSLKGNLTEDIICVLQWSDESQIFLVLNNETKMELEVTGSDAAVSYKMTGKGIDGSAEIKELIELNNSYILKLNSLEREFNTLGGTAEDALRMTQLSNAYAALRLERNNAIKQLVLGKKKSLIPYLVGIYGMVEDVDLAFLDHCLASLKAVGEESRYYKEFLVYYNTEKLLAVGSVAPEITQKTPEGTLLSLSSLKGKVVLIDFWASWCQPCRRENPNVRRMYNRFKDQGFEIYGVSLDNDPGRWKSAINADSLGWKHVSDLGGWQSKPALAYKVTSIPQTYLLDREGKIVAKGLRGPALEAKVEELLRQRP